MEKTRITHADGTCDDVCCTAVCPTCERLVYPTWAAMCDCADESKEDANNVDSF